MAENNLQGLMGVSMDKIKEMVDANTVIGNPIPAGEGTTLIPVSKISYGFASGGSNIPSKTQAELFGGGSGAGINITPIALIVINQNGVQALPIVSKPETSDKMVNLVPEMFDKLTSLFSKKKETTETVEVKAGAENGESSVTVTETETSGGKE